MKHAAVLLGILGLFCPPPRAEPKIDGDKVVKAIEHQLALYRRWATEEPAGFGTVGHVSLYRQQGFGTAEQFCRARVAEYSLLERMLAASKPEPNH
jgi:hypothetical protein